MEKVNLPDTDYAALELRVLDYLKDDPDLWLKIIGPCSDPMGPKTALVESLSRPNIQLPKDLFSGWKDE